MRVWSFVSQKGGAGRSTLSTQLAVYAEQRGEAVCLLDMDPQRSAVVWGEHRDSRGPTVLPAEPGALSELIVSAANLGFTLVLIDTAPHSDGMALAAIDVANLIVCPTQSSLFDIAALADTAALLDLREARGRAITVINGLPTVGTESVYDTASVAITRIGLKLATARVCHRRAFVVAVNTAKGVTELSKSDKAASEIHTLWLELNALAPIEEKRTEVAHGKRR